MTTNKLFATGMTKLMKSLNKVMDSNFKWMIFQ